MVIFVVVILLWNTFQAGRPDPRELTYNEFNQQVIDGRVAEVVLRDKTIEGEFKEGGPHNKGDKFHVELPFRPGPDRLEAGHELRRREDEVRIGLADQLVGRFLGAPMGPAQGLRIGGPCDGPPLFGGEDALVEAAAKGLRPGVDVEQVDDVISEHRSIPLPSASAGARSGRQTSSP